VEVVEQVKMVHYQVDAKIMDRVKAVDAIG